MLSSEPSIHSKPCSPTCPWKCVFGELLLGHRQSAAKCLAYSGSQFWFLLQIYFHPTRGGAHANRPCVCHGYEPLCKRWYNTPVQSSPNTTSLAGHDEGA